MNTWMGRETRARLRYRCARNRPNNTHRPQMMQMIADEYISLNLRQSADEHPCPSVLSVVVPKLRHAAQNECESPRKPSFAPKNRVFIVRRHATRPTTQRAAMTCDNRLPKQPNAKLNKPRAWQRIAPAAQNRGAKPPPGSVLIFVWKARTSIVATENGN
jgi:hypothetical protein